MDVRPKNIPRELVALKTKNIECQSKQKNIINGSGGCRNKTKPFFLQNGCKKFTKWQPKQNKYFQGS